MTTIEAIPDDIVLHILHFLEPHELPIFISKKWYALSSSETLWQGFMMIYFPRYSSTLEEGNIRQMFVILWNLVILKRKVMNLGRNLHTHGT